MKLFIPILLLSLGLPNQAMAKTPSIKVLALIRKVAHKHHLDTQSLLAIASVESNFDQGARRLNKNHTVDVGMFQVNSVHWDTTCKGLDVLKLRGNLECAARIIEGHQGHAASDKAWLGRYHSKTPSKKLAYYKLLMARMDK